MVASVTPAGTITQTARGAVQLLGQLGHARDVAPLQVVVQTDHLVTGGAQSLAHVAAHPAEAYQAELHLVATFRAVGYALPVSGTRGSA